MNRFSSWPVPKKTRALFLTWGFSIHAKRRIQIFMDDPSFEVIIASTYNYGFQNSLPVSLGGTDEREKVEKGTCLGKGERAATKNRKKYLNNFIKAFRLIREVPGALKVGFEGWGMLAPVLSSKDRHRLGGLRGVRDFFLTPDRLKEILRASWDLKILKRAVIDLKPDIVFLQTLLYPSYLAFFLPRALPMIITFWNGDLTWWAQWTGTERKLKKAIITYGLRRASAITVNSAFAFNKCIESGTEKKKIHLIRYPGVDLDMFKPSDKGQARIKLGIKSEKVVFWPRGLGGYLNSDIMIEAIPAVIKKHKSTLFVFVSGGDKKLERRKHLQRVKELGCEGHVRWEGNVPWELMPRYYSASDVMVSISSNDSLPNCMMEAMACGRPVLMGDIPSTREWITDGVNGFLVPPRDQVALSEKIIMALDAPQDRMMSFVEKNHELARRFFDSRQNSREIKKLVCEIAGNNP